MGWISTLVELRIHLLTLSGSQQLRRYFSVSSLLICFLMQNILLMFLLFGDFLISADQCYKCGKIGFQSLY